MMLGRSEKVTNEERLLELAQDVDFNVRDVETFAGGFAYNAKGQHFNEALTLFDRAIEHAESLPHKLRELKKFIEAHPEMAKPEW